MVLDKEEIRESLTENDIELILIELGSDKPKHDSKDNLIFTTVCHGGHKHKLYYYNETKMFHCYTDCSESFDIYSLVMKAKKQQGKDLTFYQAIQYVANLTGKYYSADSTLQKAESNLINDWEWINRFKKKEKVNHVLPKYDTKVMDIFIHKPHELWLDEGISYETMKKFNICYYQREEKIVIPHYSIDGDLVGIRGRALRQEDIDAGKKYMPLYIENRLYNHPTMYNLYGLHKTKEAIKRLKKVAIFESEKSVLKCEDLYGDNNFSVAVCSSNVSNYHRDLLISLGVEEVFLCFDKEFKHHESEEAYEYAKKIMKFAQKFAPYARVYILWDEWGLLELKDSPVDKGREVLETLMKRKYEISTIGEVDI